MIENIPPDLSLVLRTDFSDDNVWTKICHIISSPKGFLGFTAQVKFYNDKSFENASAEKIITSLPKDRDFWFIFIVDHITVSHQEHPVLCVDLLQEFGRTFRVIAKELYVVENNLSTLNMDFTEIYNSVGSDGVHRGVGDIEF